MTPTHIQPLPMEAITDPALRALIAKGAACGVPDPTFGRILAHMPEYAKVTLDALLHSHFEGGVDHKLKEVIRVLLARFAQDPYFSSLRSKPAQAAGLDEATIEAGRNNYERDPRFSEGERLAIRFADQMYLNPDAVDAELYTALKRHFTEAQIMELGAFVALHYGMQIFMRTLDASRERG